MRVDRRYPQRRRAGVGRSGAARQIVIRKLKPAECRETLFTHTERHINVAPLSPGSVPRMLAIAIRSYGLRPPVGTRWSAA